MTTAVAAPTPALRFGHIDRRRLLTPNVVAVTVGGIDAVEAMGRGGDAFVYALVRSDGAPLPLGWTMADHRPRSPDNPVLGAYYTIRAARPSRCELDLWVVQHDHPTGAGAAMARLPIGTPVALWGPRPGFSPPPGARRALLLADETGAAAMATLLEILPSTAAVTAVFETVDADHHLPLPARPGLSVHWVHRGAAPPGGAANHLLASIRELGPRPRFDVVFGAAETRVLRAVRRQLRRDQGMSAGALQLTGYWRRIERSASGGRDAAAADG